ncbi:hypothetical protein GmHk_18G052358 [Glycine max]|nr:hypothetical protein GmHk_18G052358 [Glycine max]
MLIITLLSNILIGTANQEGTTFGQFFSWDEGACFTPKEIWSSMMLVHRGNTNTKHDVSFNDVGACYAPKFIIPSNRRGFHPCFDPKKDHMIPAWKVTNVHVLSPKLWAWPLEKQKTPFYFNLRTKKKIQRELENEG